jgi:hypothetical protein
MNVDKMGINWGFDNRIANLQDKELEMYQGDSGKRIFKQV